MGKLLIWLSTHPDVNVRFCYDTILAALQIRVVKGRYISERLIDEAEYSNSLNELEDHIILVLNALYDRLEKEMKKDD